MNCQFAHGSPAAHALDELMISFLDFLERQRQETAIPAQDAAVSQEVDEVAVAMQELHCTQDSTQNGEIKQWT